MLVRERVPLAGLGRRCAHDRARVIYGRRTAEVSAQGSQIGQLTVLPLERMIAQVSFYGGESDDDAAIVDRIRSAVGPPERTKIAETSVLVEKSVSRVPDRASPDD